MKRVTFVDQFYYPDASAIAQLLTELTIGLQLRGWQVRVVTSSDEYAKPERPAPVDPEKTGVQVYRTPSFGRGSMRRGKLLRQLLYCLLASGNLFFSRAPDLYVVQTTPPLIPICVAIVAQLKRRPYAIIAQDLYPEILSVHGMLHESHPVYRALERVTAWAYRKAEKVVSLGPYMSARLRTKGVRKKKIQEISNWGVGELAPWKGENPLRREWGLEGSFVVLYSGNMGLGHEFDTFLEGAQEAKAQLDELEVVFVGEGARKEEIASWVAEHGANNWVRFKPYQSQERLRESLGVADLSLVTLREDWAGLLVPSKILGVLAMGSPTLYVGPESDISELLHRFSAGVHIRNGDARGVREAILRAAQDEEWLRRTGEGARQSYVGSLDRDSMIDLYDKTLAEILK